jgi:hypothetical protein
MCNWGNDDPYDWAYTIANSWRMSGDIYGMLHSGSNASANRSKTASIALIADVLATRQSAAPGPATIALS